MKARMALQWIVICILLVGAVPLDIGLFRWFRSGRRVLTHRDRRLILFGACTAMLGLCGHVLLTDLRLGVAMIPMFSVFLFLVMRRRALAQERNT